MGVFVCCEEKMRVGKAVVGSLLLVAYGLTCVMSEYEISKIGKNNKSDNIVRKSAKKFQLTFSWIQLII